MFVNSLSKVKSIFSNNDLLNKASGGFLIKAIAIGLNYFFVLLITRLFGVDSWGVMAICLSIINILSVFGRMGIDTSVLKFASSLKKGEGAFISIYFKGLKLILIFGCIVTLGTYLFSDLIAVSIFKKEHIGKYIKVASFGILPYSVLFLNAQMYRAEQRTKEYFLVVDVLKFLIPIILTTVLYFFLKLSFDIVAIYSFVIALYISMIISSYTFFKKWLKIKSISTLSTLSNSKILNTALPLFLGSSALLIMGWMDTLMIGYFHSDEETGMYNILVKISQVPTIVLIAVNGILAPKISNYFNNGQIQEFRKIVYSSSKFILIGSTPCFLILIIFYQDIINLFNLSKFNTDSVFFILLLGQFINVFSGSVALILQMIGEQKFFSRILLASLLLNIFLNLILIEFYGVLGASIATTICLMVWNFGSVLFIYQKHSVFTIFYPKFLKTFFIDGK